MKSGGQLFFFHIIIIWLKHKLISDENNQEKEQNDAECNEKKAYTDGKVSGTPADVCGFFPQ